MHPPNYLLKFQIGPVQDFIATARSTRDLWSGSYLLSWLVAEGIKKLPSGSELIFPSRSGQPLLDTTLNPDRPGILIPNLPNIFIAEIKGNALETARQVEAAIRAEWGKIADSVWEQRSKIGLPQFTHDRFRAQVDHHLSISWQITEIGSQGYAEAYPHNGWHLDAVRQTRDFKAWDSATRDETSRLTNEKDSLTGREEALVGGTDYQKKMQELKLASKGTIAESYASLFAKHADYLGAVAIIKRSWHLAYLNHAHTPTLKTRSGEFIIRSIPAIAARTCEPDDKALPQEKTQGDGYIAAIAFDGDSIGKWVNGDFLPRDMDLRNHHSSFSQALSSFALGRVREIVEGTAADQLAGNWKGQLIYAGGDDVVCLVPADAALDVASKLREAFREATQSTETTDGKPDASAGIAIAHIHSPLQDLIREAQRAETRAKTEVGRPAFSITLMKRSGEISHWGGKWDDPGKPFHEIPCGVALHDTIAEAMNHGGLSAKFPHRVCELLSPYLVSQSTLMEAGKSMQDAITETAIAKELIRHEFFHAAERQGSKEAADLLRVPFTAYLEGVLKARTEREIHSKKPSSRTPTQELLISVIGLCTTVAFAHRNKSSAEK